MIYLDNAATTYPKPDAVIQAMDYANKNLAVNAGRGAYHLAREASKVITDTKNKIRNIISADSTASVIFTPSITIALNEVIHGMHWRPGDVVYASPYEHNAVARTLNAVQSSCGIKIKLLPVNQDTLEIDVEKIKYEFSQDKPKAVFCTHVSNVTGYILPIHDIFGEAKKFDAITVLDSAQSLGLVNVNAQELNADIVAFAGHKTLYGPFGIGGFINVNNISLEPSIYGGTGSDSLNLQMPDDKELGFEPSSMNVVAVNGLNVALSELNQSKLLDKEQKLTNYLIDELKKIPEIKLYLPSDLTQHVGIVSFTINGMVSEDVGTILDEDFDIAVRTGYHCAPWIHEILKDKKSLGTVRVGLGQFTSKEDIDELVQALFEFV